jgi:hypothetical protein
MSHSFLVVDDSKLHHQMYKLVFSRGSLAGSTVHHATNGREGYALLAAHPELALVFLDLNMPEMNGLEVLIRRRAERLHLHADRAGDDRGHRGRRGSRPCGGSLGVPPEAVSADRRGAAGEPGPGAGTGPHGLR